MNRCFLLPILLLFIYSPLIAKTLEVKGVVYLDENLNKKREKHEPGILGVRVMLLCGRAVSSYLTTSSGFYKFRIDPKRECSDQKISLVAQHHTLPTGAKFVVDKMGRKQISKSGIYSFPVFYELTHYKLKKKPQMVFSFSKALETEYTIGKTELITVTTKSPLTVTVNDYFPIKTHKNRFQFLYTFDDGDNELFLTVQKKKRVYKRKIKLKVKASQHKLVRYQRTTTFTSQTGASMVSPGSQNLTQFKDSNVNDFTPEKVSEVAPIESAAKSVNLASEANIDMFEDTPKDQKPEKLDTIIQNDEELLDDAKEEMKAQENEEEENQTFSLAMREEYTKIHQRYFNELFYVGYGYFNTNTSISGLESTSADNVSTADFDAQLKYTQSTVQGGVKPFMFFKDQFGNKYLHRIVTSFSYLSGSVKLKAVKEDNSGAIEITASPKTMEFNLFEYFLIPGLPGRLKVAPVLTYAKHSLNISDTTYLVDQEYSAIKAGAWFNFTFVGISSDIIFGASKAVVLDYKVSAVPEGSAGSASLMNGFFRVGYKIPQNLTTMLFENKQIGFSIGFDYNIEMRSMKFEDRTITSNNVSMGLYLRGGFYLR